MIKSFSIWKEVEQWFQSLGESVSMGIVQVSYSRKWNHFIKKTIVNKVIKDAHCSRTKGAYHITIHLDQFSLLDISNPLWWQRETNSKRLSTFLHKHTHTHKRSTLTKVFPWQRHVPTINPHPKISHQLIIPKLHTNINQYILMY